MALNLPLEEKLAASINRRRIAEEMRKHRIFDAKQRQIGVDIEALNHQMHEHIMSRNKQDEIEKHFADEIKKQDHLAELFKQREEEENRELRKKLDDFRLSEQRPEYRRDFDLYDPDHLRKEKPPRVSDHQFCPVSGLQKLEGEDLNYKNRSNKQKEQVKDLLLQQMQEKRMKNFIDSKEDSDWESLLLKNDSKAKKLSKAELEDQRKKLKNLSDLNKYLATQSIERKFQQKVEDDHENRKDILANFYGDLLTENPLVARSSFGSHRVIPDRWKGMSKQQLEEYFEGQMQQILDKKLDKDREMYENAKWDEIISRQATKSKLEAEEEQKQKDEIKKKQVMENQQLSQEQKLQQAYINKIVYSNVPSEEYFNQFNTTSR